MSKGKSECMGGRGKSAKSPMSKMRGGFGSKMGGMNKSMKGPKK